MTIQKSVGSILFALFTRPSPEQLSTKSDPTLEGYLYMYHVFLIHSSVDEHLGCFHVLAIVNTAEMNNGIYVSFSVLVSSGYIPNIRIAGSYGGFILSF